MDDCHNLHFFFQKIKTRSHKNQTPLTTCKKASLYFHHIKGQQLITYSYNAAPLTYWRQKSMKITKCFQLVENKEKLKTSQRLYWAVAHLHAENFDSRRVDINKSEINPKELTPTNSPCSGCDMQNIIDIKQNHGKRIPRY